MNYLVPLRPPVINVPPANVSPAEDAARTRILQNFRPSYYTAAGLATATLHKLTRLHNGQVGALYDVKISNPATGKRESSRYLYGVGPNGLPKELKKLSTLVS